MNAFIKKMVTHLEVFLFYLCFVFCILSSCKDTGGEVQGTVTSGINGNGLTASWDFRTPSDYTYDSNYIDVLGNKASLKQVTSTFNSSSTFDTGTHVGTHYSGGVLKPRVFSSTDVDIAQILPSRSASLMGYWKMENNWNDSSGNANTLSNTGLPTFVRDTRVGTYATLFNGTSQYLSINSASLRNSTFTYMAWVRPASLATAGTIIGWSASGGPQFRINTTGRVALLKQGNSGLGNSVTSLKVGQWAHVACTSDSSGNWRIYVNGALEASGSFSGGFVFNNFQIGAFGAASEYFNGSIDEVASFSTDLTASEISSVYSAQARIFSNDTSLYSSWTPKWSSIVAYWKLDGDWLDSSGNGNALTPGGGTATLGTTNVKVGAGASNYTGTHSASTANTSIDFSGGMTASAWVRPTSSGVFREVMRKGAGADQQYQMNYSAAGAFGCIIRNVGQISLAESSGLRTYTNDWVYVVCVYEASTQVLSLYVDGQLRNSTSTGGIAPSTTSSAMVVGGSTNWIGDIDDAAVWNTSLTAAEVALIYNRQKQKYAGMYTSPIVDMGSTSATWTSLIGSSALPFLKELPSNSASESATSYSSVGGGLTSGLVGLWRFNETSGTSLSDHSTSANAATTVNSPSLGMAGVLGFSTQFNGTNQYARVPNTSAMYSFPDQTFTVSAWFKTTTTNFPSYLVALEAVSRGWGLFLSTGGIVSVVLKNSVNTSAGEFFSTTSGFNDGKWHQIVALISTSTSTPSLNRIDIYVDGKLLPGTHNVQTTTYESPSNAYRLSFGARNTSGAPLSYLNGSIDEVAIWSRALSATEILELYRRGANRVKYQVRSCVESTCSCKSLSTAPIGSASDCDGDGITNSSDTSDSHAAHFFGPDGSGTTFFSELQNNTSVDASGNPTGSVNVTSLNLDWSSTFFTASARPATNRYFQYRVLMESDEENNLCSSAPCFPELTSLTVGPVGRYYGGNPSIVNNTPVSFSQLQTITRSDTSSCTKYQISTDGGTTWKWWNGSAWATTSGGGTNSNYLSDFFPSRLLTLGNGSFKFKAFLNSSADLTQSCDLSQVGIFYSP